VMQLANSLKSQVNPQIKKSQTAEALKVNKSVNQSEKTVRDVCRHRNRAMSYSTPETGDG